MKKDIENIVNKYITEHHFNIRRKMAQEIESLIGFEQKRSHDFGCLDERMRLRNMNWLQRIFYK